MSDALLHTQADKSVFSGHRDNQVQWWGGGEAWLQSEFEQCEAFTQKAGNNRGVKTLVGQTSFIGAWVIGQIYIPDDSNLWGKFPYVWKIGQKELESRSDYIQAEIRLV